MPKSYNFSIILAILVLAGSTSIMSTDLYTPSLPHLAAYFHTSPSMVKLTISLNLMMFGIAQLFHGPLSDRYGRRPVLLSAIVAFTVFSIACALAQTIGQLIAARMLQGFTAAAEAVICLAVFKDLFGEKEQIRALAIYGMAIAVAPAIAPIIGGYVHVWFGWQVNFLLTAGLGVVTAILIWALLPESAEPDPEALKPQRLMTGYLYLLTNRHFMVHAGLLGAALGTIYVFVTGGPFVLISQLGVATENFGYYQACIVAAFFVGSVIATRLAGRWEADRLLRLGLLVLVAGGVALIGFIFADGLTPVTFTAAFCLMTFGLGPVFAVAPSKAMRVASRGVGSAAAMLGAIELTLSGFAAGAVGLLHDGTARPLGLTMAALIVVILILGRMARTS